MLSQFHSPKSKMFFLAGAAYSVVASPVLVPAALLYMAAAFPNALLFAAIAVEESKYPESFLDVIFGLD